MHSVDQLHRPNMVLIVDANELYTERMIDLLEGTGVDCQYNIAGGFYPALDIVHREFPDIMILELQLPDRNGIELLRELKSLGSSCKVVVISNHTESHYREECLDLGAVYFLDKTLEFEKLPTILKELCSGKKIKK